MLGRLAVIIGNVVDAIEPRITQPGVDGGFAPANAARADLDVSRKRAALHLPVHGRAAEPGTSEDGVDPEDAVGSLGLH